MKGVRKEQGKYHTALQVLFASEFKRNYSELESVLDNENEIRNKTFMDTQLKTQHFRFLVGLQTFSWWYRYAMCFHLCFSFCISTSLETELSSNGI